MRGVLGVLRSLGVVVGVWGILGLVAWASGLMPPGGRSQTDRSGPTGGQGGHTDPPVTPGPEGSVDAGERDGAADGAVLARVPAARHEVCFPPAAAPGLLAAHILGDPRPEILVACHDRVQVLAVERLDGEDGAELLPMQVAVFTPADSGDGVAAPPAVADVDGDDLPDLVLPYYRGGAEGTVSPGPLFLVRRRPDGSFDRPEPVARVAGVYCALAPLDAEDGAELVVMHRTSVTRSRSEVWVFAGGPAPTRRERLTTGIDGRAVATADLDGDGHGDIVAVVAADPRVDVFFGDGRGEFPRSTTVTIAGGAEALTGDVDGDGRSDVVIVATGLFLIRARSGPELTADPLGVPTTLRQVALADLDGDGKLDIVGVDAEGLRWFRQGDRMTFEARPLLLVPELHAVRYALADFDGDDIVDIALLRRPADDQPLGLVVIPGPLPGRAIALSEESTPIAEAPLMLSHVLDMAAEPPAPDEPRRRRDGFGATGSMASW